MICDQILTNYNYDPQSDSCTTQKSKLGKRYWYKTYETYIFQFLSVTRIHPCLKQSDLEKSP